MTDIEIDCKIPTEFADFHTLLSIARVIIIAREIVVSCGSAASVSARLVSSYVIWLRSITLGEAVTL